MAHYTFDIIKYTLITEEGETYKDFIEMMPSLTVQATNYIAATLKAEKAYPENLGTAPLKIAAIPSSSQVTARFTVSFFFE